ncbi:hypothetical protein DPMN_156011 [Dreissena polymorpha]|uniref:Uncharacterized protein n=1 Tax=Dreissena polymorpha TaxID=45954 RepID=A0A9D4FQF9_DREPO|nr:hypothetical protein DPMN_156011 [Dreissena polymorpha]
MEDIEHPVTYEDVCKFGYPMVDFTYTFRRSENSTEPMTSAHGQSSTRCIRCDTWLEFSQQPHVCVSGTMTSLNPHYMEYYPSAPDVTVYSRTRINRTDVPTKTST